MGDENPADKLKVFWDHFFKAETGTYEKSTWLDLFLAEFIIQTNAGANPKELLNFCPLSGVVSLVGCELLCGIHRVTSSIHTHCGAPMQCADNYASSGNTSQDEWGKPEDRRLQTSLLSRMSSQSSAEILRKYLLGGLAWKCLVLLKALGVEGLSCCRQLSSVLLWVWGELRGGGGQKLQLTSSTTPIHQLFSPRIWSKQKTSGSRTSKIGSAVSSERSYAGNRSNKRQSQLKNEANEKVRRKIIKLPDASSESADSNDDLQMLNRSLTIKVTTPDDFQYFDSPVHPNKFPNDSLFGDLYYTPRKTKPKAEDFMTDKHREIINSEVTAYEFMLLVIDLLQELCKTESSLSGSEGSLISMQCINFSLRTLCSIQFGSLSSYSSHYDAVEQSSIKIALTQLLMVSLDKVLLHSDLCAKLINNGILPMLLRLIEDVICKSGAKYNLKTDEHCRNKDVEKPNVIESENLLRFIFGIAFSITAFFHCLLMQCRTIDKLREFTEQFKLYGECLKGGLFKECIELMIRIPGVNFVETTTLIKKLIESIGKLISGMKRVRSEVIHSAACPRSRHKVCRQRVTAGMHHHHDIMGEANSALPMSSACCISVLYGTLTSLVTDEEVTAQTSLKTKILRVMLNCGVCCCFPSGFLMESIVRLMLTHNNVAPLCLQVLEHSVYGELGASVLIPKPLTDQLPCSICEPCDEKREFGRKYCTHGISPLERKTVWSFLIHYNSLLQLDNHNNVLHATVSHLLRVTPRCRTEMKYELLFSVIYPTFIVAKHRYMIRMEESAYFLTAACLNIFSSLLNTISFAEQFISKGGLSYVLELVTLSEFSTQCCAILEISIIVEIYKLMKDNSEMAYYREMNSLASVQMFFKCLSDVTTKCFKIYKMKLPIEKYDDLCDVSKETENLAASLTGRGSLLVNVNRNSVPILLKSGYAQTENVLEDAVDDYIEVLKNISVFWKSCAGLCLYSPMFREFLLSESVFLDSYSLTKMLLYFLCHCEYVTTEMRIVIKILEAVLTVQFSVSDVTSNRSGEASCRLLRSCLEEPEILLSAGCGSETDLLRVLSEALLRVSCAAPSDRHVMPTANPPKVPPLVCEEDGSSAECSSSEESVQPPYASEHSEHGFRGGMGYEADVEGGKLDSLIFKSRKQSLSNSTINSDIPSSPHLLDHSGIECGEYVKSGELAHPELCSIVVDVLTQLIDKVVSTRDASSIARVQRMCGAVARASGGAGARGGATLRGLLRTLLRRLDQTPPELQRSILELVQVLASQQVSGRELKALFSVLLCEKPPLAPVLGTLHQLAAAAQRAPKNALVFPIPLTQPEGVELGKEASPGVTAYTTNDFTRQSYLTNTNTGAHQGSAWRVGAARAGVESAGGAPWLRGASYAVWIRTIQEKDSNHWHDTSSDPEDCEPRPPAKKEMKATELLHVFSIGNDSLLFEMWLDPGVGTLTFRISRDGRPLSESSTSGRVPARCWSCVCVNISERLYKKRLAITAAVFVDGVEWPTVHLPFQGILVRKVTATTVVLGHVAPARSALPAGGATSTRAPYLQLAGLAVYRLPTITATTATLLAARLPPYHTLVGDEHPNIPALLTPDLLQSDIDWNQVYESPSAALRELQDDLLMMYSAHAPEVINLYHHTVNMPTAGALFPRGAATSVAPPAAEALRMQWGAPPRPAPRRALPTALMPQPNVDALLYLFARVVELEGTEEQQATALWIVLHTCLLDDQMYAAFYEEECLSMIHTVLQSNKCKISIHMLKAILDVAFSGTVLSCWNGRGILHATAEPVLKHPKLIAALMNAWRQLETREVKWEVETGSTGRTDKSGTVWSLALDCLLVVFREDNPRRPFNVSQAERTKLLPALMHCIKERFLNSECAPAPLVWSALVQAARGLVPSPPAPAHAACLNDVLLLMHQASDTFVTHSRSNFYFLVTPETQESSVINTMNFGDFDVKRKSIRRTKRQNNRRSISSNNSDEIPSENGLSAKSYKGQKHDVESDKTDHESSVESTKLLKGLINMQIKEKRKHTLSSTSETSTEEPWENDKKDPEKKEEIEPTIEINGSDNDEDLSGYVVVEQQDVERGGAEMYSWGGAEMYSWGGGVVAGLLSLLKDVIAALPHHLLPQAMASGVHPDRIVVLANQPSASVRAALVELLAVLQRRTPIDPKRNLAFTYTHLANQISLYPGSMELAATCAALITKCDVPLEDQLHSDIWTDVSEESLSRSGPLLSLLASTVHDVAASRAIVAVCRRITAQASLKLLSELLFVEAVIKAIKAVGTLTDEEIEKRTELLAEMYDLLNDVTVKALASNYNMQIITDMHHLLTYLECTTIGTAVSRLAEEAQVSLFDTQLEYLEERLYSSYTHTNKYSNYFTTVLSSSFEASSRSELAARHSSTLQRAINFILRASPSRAREPRTRLMLRLMRYLLLAVGDSATQRPKWWVSTISSTEWVPSLLEMFWWGAAPADGTRPVQGDLLRLLYGAPPAALAQLVNTMPACAKKMSIYVMCMVQHMHAVAEAGEGLTAGVELAVTDWARGWAVAAQAALAERLAAASLAAAATAHRADDDARWARQANSARNRTALAKSVFNKEALCSRVTDSAMSTTRAVVEAQNFERKAFMELLRQAQATHAAAAQRWARLIDRTTHRHAVWFDPARYPRSWALDPTEGRSRVRPRLRRAHLRIHERFLQPHAKYKARIARLPAPLSSVVCGGAGGAGLRRGEAVSQQARVTLVTCARDAPGDLLLTDRSIHFIPEELEETKKKKEKIPDPKKIDPSSIEDVTVQAWPLDTIIQVETRRWCLQEVALEIFLSTGRAHLLAFGTQAERDAFRAALPTKHAAKSQSDGLAEAMSAWRAGTITNWEYLMKLNGLAGRSYNDLMQYPVFPFVLSDYTSRTLDLSDPAVFRDLSRPMAIQNKSREAHYINTYNDLKAAHRSSSSPQLTRQPHHYASLYSNSGGILHYMVRVPPFTQLLLAYQDNNFDMPDRTFHSLATTWRLITQDSPTDVKELIPEMFYLPELFYNREGLSLGVRQCGAAVENVLTAAWAADARLFTLLQRQALEASVVTSALPKWIDLVFGYKQTGQAAIDAINVFPPCTYYGFDPSSLANEVDRTAAHTMVRTYGQAPRQLLRTVHPHQTPALHPLPTGVWNNMAGVSWGRYCGSPALRTAGAAARRGAGAARACPLPAPRAAALLPPAAALTQLHEDKNEEGCSVMLVSWGHADGHVRGKTRRDNTREILLHAPNITSSGFVLTASARPYPLFLGLSTGEVLAVRVSGTARCRARPLLAHKTSIASIHVCASTALLVTASVDGRVVLWDLNRLTYIRTLPNRRQLSVSHVTISPTLADVATVHDLTTRDPADLDPDSDDDDDLEYGDLDTGADVDNYEQDTNNYKSLIRVYTCNGSFVASVKVPETVRCICYSGAAEGVSINVVCAGLSNGEIRLYCSWQLSPVTVIPPPTTPPSALLSVTYSSDSSILFACYADGASVAFESQDEEATRQQNIKLVPAHALL